MTIGPGGIGGPKGPGGPGGVDGAGEVGDVDGLDEVGDVGDASPVSASQLDALAADIASGKLTAREAIDRMVDHAGADLGAPERAELRELLTDLVENDPYLQSLTKQI